MSEKAPKVKAEDTTLDEAEQHTVDERALVTKVDSVDDAQSETARATLGPSEMGQYEVMGQQVSGEMIGIAIAAGFAALAALGIWLRRMPAPAGK